MNIAIERKMGENGYHKKWRGSAELCTITNKALTFWEEEGNQSVPLF